MQQTIEVEVALHQSVNVNIHICDIIQAINELPMARRWNAVASILNHIDATEVELDAKQKELTIEWLKKKLERFNEL
jgi:hypothetical protein